MLETQLNFSSTEEGLLHVPFARISSVQKRAFSVVGLSIWNALPLVLCSLPRTVFQAFLSQLEMVLFGHIVVGSASEQRPLKRCSTNSHNEWIGMNQINVESKSNNNDYNSNDGNNMIDFMIIIGLSYFLRGLLDASLDVQYDLFKSAYASILFQWGLMNQRAELLHFLSTQPPDLTSTFCKMTLLVIVRVNAHYIAPVDEHSWDVTTQDQNWRIIVSCEAEA